MQPERTHVYYSIIAQMVPCIYQQTFIKNKSCALILIRKGSFFHLHMYNEENLIHL